MAGRYFVHVDAYTSPCREIDCLGNSEPAHAETADFHEGCEFITETTRRIRHYGYSIAEYRVDPLEGILDIMYSAISLEAVAEPSARGEAKRITIVDRIATRETI